VKIERLRISSIGRGNCEILDAPSERPILVQAHCGHVKGAFE
jgi:hypothetical protein